MDKKSKYKPGKKQRAFQIVNTLVIVAILAFYGYRLFYYKDLFDNTTVEVETNDDATFLYDVLITRTQMDVVNTSYDEEEDTYYFGNDFEYSYVEYCGRLFRVLDIDETRCVRAVSLTIETYAVLETADTFSDTSLYAWLNKGSSDTEGFYQSSLSNTVRYLANTYYYSSVVDSADDIGSGEKVTTAKVSLLTLEDYQRLGGADSYLNDGTSYWLANNNSEGYFWYVDNDGSIVVGSNSTQLNGVRPVVSFNNEVTIISGSGTEDDPYIIEETSEVTTIADSNIGDYISYSGYVWRVVDTSDGVQLMLNEVLETSITYGSSNEYDTSSGIGGYLNDTFLNSLNEYETYLKETTFYYGSFSFLDSDYDYRNTYTNEVVAYVGLPTTATRILDDNFGYITPMMVYNSTSLVYTIDADGYLYYVSIDENVNVRPVICMNEEIEILSGDGTIESPYIVEEVSSDAE